MIKEVIFDYGGIVKKSHPIVGDLAEIFNMPEEEVKNLEEKLGEARSLAGKGLITDEQLFQKFSEILGKPAPEGCVDMAKKFYRDTFVFIPEIIDLIKEIKARGIKTAVLSNISVFETEAIDENGGYDMFDDLFLSCREKLYKPDTAFYSLAVGRLGVKPEECIFIDDQEKNLPPAQSIGMKTVLFENPKQAVKEILDIINSEK